MRLNRKSLLHRLICAILVLQILATDLLIVAAQAQTAAAHEAVEATFSIFDRLSNGIQSLDANPSYELAKTIILPESLRMIRVLDARLNHVTAGSPEAADRGRRDKYVLYHHNRVVNALAVADQIAHLTHDQTIKDSVFSSVLDIVPDVNPASGVGAVAMPERDALDSQGRPHGGTFILPPLSGDTATDSVVRDTDVSLLLRHVGSLQTTAGMTAATGPQSALYSARMLKMRLVHENRIAFLKSYWLYQGRFVKSVPTSNSAAILDVFSDFVAPSQFSDFRTALDQVRHQLRHDSEYRFGQFRENKNKLLRHLRRKRRDLLAARNHAPIILTSADMNWHSVNTEGNAAGAWLTLQAVDEIANIWPRQHTYRTGSTATNAERGEVPMSIMRVVEAARPYLGVLLGLNRRELRCFPDGKVEVDTRSHPFLRDIFALIYPGHEQDLLNQYLDYSYRQRPRAAQGGEPTDRCITPNATKGFNRRAFFTDFLESIYASRFGTDATTPLADITPWQLDGSAAYRELLTRSYSEEPLLNTEAIRASFEDTSMFQRTGTTIVRTASDGTREEIVMSMCGGWPCEIRRYRGHEITLSHITEALEQQKEAIQANMQELKDLLRTTSLAAPLLSLIGMDESSREHSVSTTNEVLVTLLERNPVAAWRIVAKDWRYIKPVADAYAAFAAVRHDQEIRDRVYFWAGMVLMVGSVVTLGAGFLVAGPVGGALITAGTVIGFVAGSQALYTSVDRAFTIRRDYNAMVAHILAGIGDNQAQRRQAERLSSAFYMAVAEAVISGAFLALDASALMGAVRGMTALRQARRLIDLANAERVTGSGVMGAFSGAETEIRFLGQRFSVLSRAERNANAQATLINEIFERSASRETDEWTRDVIRRMERASTYPTVEEVIALGLRRIDSRTVTTEVRRSLWAGHRFTISAMGDGFSMTMARSMRYVGDATGRPIGRGWISRFAERMGYGDITQAGPLLQTKEQVDRFFGTLFRESIPAQFEDPSLFFGLANSMRETAFHTIAAGELRPGAVLRRFLDEIRGVTTAPARIMAHEQDLLRISGEELGSLSPQFSEALCASVTGADGGFWPVLRRSLLDPRGRLDEVKLAARVADWRRLWFYIWGSFEILSTQQLYAEASDSAGFIENYGEYVLSDGTNPAIPEGTQALVRSRETTLGINRAAGEIICTDEGLNAAREEHEAYQADITERTEARRRRRICAGEEALAAGEVLTSCATTEGRTATLIQFDAFIDLKNEEIRQAEEISQSNVPAYPNPTARFNDVRRACGL